MVTSFKEWLNMLEGTRATIYTQSNSKGATVHTDDQSNEQPVMLPIDDVVNYERASKMQQPDSQENLRAIMWAIKNGQSSYFFKGEERQITPILVRRADNLRGVSNPRWDGRAMTSAGGGANSRFKYQVVDGHHRYWAYKALGHKQVPAIILAPENISREKFYTGDA